MISGLLHDAFPPSQTSVHYSERLKSQKHAGLHLEKEKHDTECPYWDQVSLNNIKPILEKEKSLPIGR